MPSASWYQQIHERLVLKDPSASAELVETILDPLIEKLRKKYPRLHDQDLLIDAVTDALVSYIKRPEQYNPEKRGLLGYLTMAAEGDLKNALAKQKRRRKKEIFLGDVEVRALSGNKEMHGNNFLNELIASQTYEEIYKLFEDSRDLKMVELILSGERSTSVFVEILGIKNQSVEEQQREVKRHKDRIKKRLKRYGERIDERQY